MNFTEYHNQSFNLLEKVNILDKDSSEKQIRGDAILEQLVKIINMTHIHHNIFVIHDVIIKDKQKHYVSLRQPSYSIKKTSITKQLSKNQQTIKQIINDLDLRLIIQVQPAIVKRENSYRIRFAITSIDIVEDFYYQTSQITIKKQQQILQQPNSYDIDSFNKKIQIIQNQKNQKQTEQIQQQYYKITSKLLQPFKKTHGLTSSGGILVRTKDKEGNFIKLNQEIKMLMLKNVFNPFCNNFIYDTKYGNTLLVGESKYYNYWHFEYIVHSYKLTLKQFTVQNKTYEKIPLTFDLKPCYNMQIIQTPVRGINCDHYYFYDLKVLYKTKIKNEQGEQYFICPTCKNKILDNKIIILNQIYPILKCVKYHEQKNKSLYQAYLTIDYDQGKVYYNFGTNSINLQTSFISKFFEYIIGQQIHLDTFRIQNIKKDQKYIFQ